MWAPDEDAANYEGVEGLKEPGFYGMIENIDNNMAKMLEFLNSSGLDDNTILIFMTDNGTAAGDEVFNAGMRGRKGSAYDGGHRVPFFMRWPGGGIEGPKDIDTLAAHIDVLPTLMDLCGIERPAGPDVHGTSLKPLLSEENPSWPDRVLVTDSQRMENLKPWRRTAVMTQRWRLVNPSIDGEPEAIELYDMQSDPGQQNDVVSSHPDVVEKLKDEYEVWWRAASEREDQYVRIGIGGPDNPARLTAHDWHGPAAEAVWNQAQIREAPAVKGWLAVDVLHPGSYRFELRRWPKEVNLPINAPYQDSEPNREKTPGKAIEARKAHLRIADINQSAALKQSDKAAVFQVELPLGPARLEAWFECAGGVERGAYYVYVERLTGTG
jgi:arylsulfatase B